MGWVSIVPIYSFFTLKAKYGVYNAGYGLFYYREGLDDLQHVTSILCDDIIGYYIDDIMNMTNIFRNTL